MKFSISIIAISILSLLGTAFSRELEGSSLVGATASLEVDVLDQAKDVYFDYLLNILKKVEIPDIDFKGGHIYQNSFSIAEQAQNVRIENVPASNAIKLSIDSLQAYFKSEQLKYKLSILTCKGTVAVDISHFTIEVTIGVTTQKLADGKIVPGFTVSNIKLDLPKDHIKIHIKGNVVAKIADAFKKLFLGDIRN
mmetsp:Transcript_1924/g.3333  ORF Transcript_1924/g.3333 Transcript_1924/m.3333 type:complete len:195 (+) Transcript_1924:32-616(+)